jgi:hypothetical protein
MEEGGERGIVSSKDVGKNNRRHVLRGQEEVKLEKRKANEKEKKS